MSENMTAIPDCQSESQQYPEQDQEGLRHFFNIFAYLLSSICYIVLRYFGYSYIKVSSRFFFNVKQESTAMLAGQRQWCFELNVNVSMATVTAAVQGADSGSVLFQDICTGVLDS